MKSRPVTPLRLLRITRGLRLSDVYDETGIPPAILSQIERGKKSVSQRMADRLSNLYSVEIVPSPNAWNRDRP